MVGALSNLGKRPLSRRGPKRNTKVEEVNTGSFVLPACLCELEDWSSALGQGFIPLAPWTPGRSADSGWNHTPGFPECPACRRKIVGFLNLRNYVSQLCTLNLFIYIYMKIYIYIYWFLLDLVFKRTLTTTIS